MQNEKTLFALLFLLVIVSVNAQLKARRNFYLIMVNKSVSIISGSLFQLLMESQILRNKIWVTNEGRDLNVYFISTPENLANLV
jgi:hypothetical protein